MDTPKEDYFMEMLDSLLEHNHCHGTPLSSKKLQEAVIRVMEDEEKYAERNINNVTTDTSFQSPVTINAQKKYANVTYEGQIASGILAETIKYFKGCRIQSTISDSTHSNSEELVDALSDSEELVDVVRNPKSNSLVATHTSDRNERYSATDTTNGNLHTNYWQTEKFQQSSKVSSLHLTKQTRMGFWYVEGICMRYVRFSHSRSSRARRPALSVFSKTLM